MTALWASGRATTSVAPIGRPCSSERHRSVGPWASLGVGIEVRALSGPDAALLDARSQVGAADRERVPCSENLALMDQAVQRPERNPEVESGLGRIEPLVLVVAGHLSSGSPSHILHAPDQLACIDFERGRQPGDHVETRVPLAALKVADVGARNPGPICQSLLGDPERLAANTDTVAKHPLAGRRSLAGASHPVIKRLRLIRVDAIGVSLSTSQREGWA